MADNSIYTDAGDSYGYGDGQDPGTQWLYNDNQALAASHAEGSSGALAAATAAPAADASGMGANDSGPSDGRHPGGAKEEGKLFVGGLSWETDEARLHHYFSKYGTIVECSIMRDQESNRPRGFGFVTFDSIDGVNAVLQEPTHLLDGKHIDPKHAIPRENQPQQQRRQNYAPQNDQFADPVKEMKGEKIFVGGLPPSATDADLNSSFAVFGTIVETKLMMDRETGRSRNYGFLEFDSEDAALEAVKAGNTVEGIQIHGKRVDVKPAVRQKRNPAMGMPGMPNMYGMMGMQNYGMMMMGMPNMYGMMGMPGYPEGADPSAYYAQMGGYYNPEAQGDMAAMPGAVDQTGMMPIADAQADSDSKGAGGGHRRHDDRGYRSSHRHDSRSGRERGRSDRGDRSSNSRGSRYNDRDRSDRERNHNRDHGRDRGDRSRNHDREGPVRSSHRPSSSRGRGFNPY